MAVVPQSEDNIAQIADWLNAEQEKSLKDYLPTTCEWITQEAQYKQWEARTGRYPILWIHGPAGCGKTVLSHFLIDRLAQNTSDAVVLSYFCDEYSSPEMILRSLLTQLLRHPKLHSQRRSVVADNLSGLLEIRPEEHDIPCILWERFLAAIDEIAPLYLVLDGLDELRREYLGGPDMNLPDMLADTVRRGLDIGVVMTSRTEYDLQSAFRSYPEILITAEKVRQDLEVFLVSQVVGHSSLAPHLDNIVPVLLQQSDGIFMWADLAVQVLSHEASLDSIQERLENMPVSLDDVYRHILQRTAEKVSQRDLMVRDQILMWVLTSVRHIRLDELSDILAFVIGPEADRPNEFSLDISGKAVELCSSLIKVDNNYLKAVHFSLKEYLQRGVTTASPNASFQAEEANSLLTQTCLKYLLSIDFEPASGEAVTQAAILQKQPLAEYATLYWCHHLSASTKADDRILNLLDSFLLSPSAFFWADTLLPMYLSRSVFPTPPRRNDSARFMYFFVLKSLVINWLEPKAKGAFEGRFAEFLAGSYEKSLQEEISLTGEKSISTLRRTLDLSEVYGWLPGRYDEALALLEQAVRTCETTSDPEHQRMTFILRQELADEYKRQGKYEKAEETLRDLLASAGPIMEPDDYRMMFALDSLGWVSMRLGHLEDAATQLQHALTLAKSLYGDRSPLTLRSKVTLAEVLGKLGRKEESETICEELKELVREIRENGKPVSRDSISQLNTLAAAYAQQGHLDEAATTYEAVVNDRRKVWGEDHPLTIWATQQLCITHAKAGNTKAAAQMLESLLPRQKAVLGPTHPNTLETAKLLVAVGGSPPD